MFVFIIQQIECDQAMKEEKNNFLLHIRWARIIFLGIIFLRHLRNRKIEKTLVFKFFESKAYTYKQIRF